MKNEEEKIKEEENNNNEFFKNKIPLPKYRSFNDKRHDKENQIIAQNEYSDYIDNNKKILSSIFFKKYKPIKIIGEGSFSVVYEGVNIKNKEKVALKIEQRNSKISLLKEEAYSIFNLQGYGIIKFISFGHSKDYNILVEPLLGESLYSLYLESKKSFTLKDICLIALQCLDRIEHIHSKGYIHADIKPENFIIGKNDPRIIYIIDFGLSKKFRSERTGRHIQFSITKKMTGTARYASTNSLRGVEISRRDDLESLSYMILYFLMKKLPWQGVRANTQQNRYKKIYYMKKKLLENESFKKLPIEIQNFHISIKKLNFKEDPNYIKLKGFFKDLLKANNFTEDENFSWINDKVLVQAKGEINLRARKSNSQRRLMDKLMRNNSFGKKYEENNNTKPVTYYKKNLSSDKKNIIYSNDGISNSNNKEIKSINEAINVEVGDFSDNENDEENNIEENKIKNLLKGSFYKNRKNNNKDKKNEIISNCNIKEYSSNKNFKYDQIEKGIKNDIIDIDTKDKYIYDYDYKNKNYTSFRQKKNLNNNTENKNDLNNNNNKDIYNRCNIQKDYMISEIKTNKDLENNRINKDNNKNINSKTLDVKKRKSDFGQKNLYSKVRSKSGEKCIIQ